MRESEKNNTKILNVLRNLDAFNIIVDFILCGFYAPCNFSHLPPFLVFCLVSVFFPNAYECFFPFDPFCDFIAFLVMMKTKMEPEDDGDER